MPIARCARAAAPTPTVPAIQPPGFNATVFAPTDAAFEAALASLGLTPAEVLADEVGGGRGERGRRQGAVGGVQAACVGGGSSTVSGVHSAHHGLR